MLKNISLILILLLCISNIFSQNTDIYTQVKKAEKEYDSLQTAQKNLLSKIEVLKLKKIQSDIRQTGLPAITDDGILVNHAAMSIFYVDKYKQPKWVVHIIVPEISRGGVTRTNNFRIDSLVEKGTAETSDYWYSGYDRGHLAPSADFRWSYKALSESYLYSNISPQKPELNREKWGELEAFLRDYVVNYNEQIYVVTGGVLKDSLPTIGENKVAIPKYFYKVVFDNDSKEKKGIGFIMMNGNCTKPLISYAVSIDSVEAMTGINFFPKLNKDEEKQIEAQFDFNKWLSEKDKDIVKPMDSASLPKGCYNTIMAKDHKGQKITVCGTVVSTKYIPKSKSTFINLDLKFPKQIFTITIWGRELNNFSYNPSKELLHKQICVTGKIDEDSEVPTMNITSEKAIEILEDN